MAKPILCLDFDGVCHSYTSGWKGRTTIPDDPVPGVEDAIRSYSTHFRIAIYSSRSELPDGIRAMKAWFNEHFPGMIEELRVMFPQTKPPAYVSLDDRAVTFQGQWPNLEWLQEFRPWNKREPEVEYKEPDYGTQPEKE
tara:strand:- start:525 stop:941 length:417 start_codon:yes stop_codon:yes gene_type:complete